MTNNILTTAIVEKNGKYKVTMELDKTFDTREEARDYALKRGYQLLEMVGRIPVITFDPKSLGRKERQDKIKEIKDILQNTINQLHDIGINPKNENQIIIGEKAYWSLKAANTLIEEILKEAIVAKAR